MAALSILRGTHANAANRTAGQYLLPWRVANSAIAVILAVCLLIVLVRPAPEPARGAPRAPLPLEPIQFDDPEEQRFRQRVDQFIRNQENERLQNSIKNMHRQPRP
jgi:hypothetical protein